MLKNSIFFLAPLLLTLASCGDDEPDTGGNGGYDNEEPAVVEEMPYATLQNADGTSYTLHADYVRLRDADNQVVAECGFTAPEPFVENLGYGESATYAYYPIQFYTTEQSLILVYGFSDIGISISSLDEPDIAFVFPKDLSDVQEKELRHGLFFLQSDNEVDILNSREDLFTYSPSLDLIKQFNSPDVNGDILLNRSNPTAFAKVDGKYYLFTIKNVISTDSSDAAILNYSDGTSTDVYLPYENDIVTKFFADEENVPRLQSKDFSFSDGNFAANFHFLKYSGEEVVVSYIFDVDGKQISPEPDHERYYVECTSLSNLSFSLTDSSSPVFNDKEFTIDYPYGATMTVCAYHAINGRNIMIPFEVYPSDSSLLTIIKATSRAEYGSTAFTLTPTGTGETDIIFSSPEVGEIDRWHYTIKDPNTQSR